MTTEPQRPAADPDAEAARREWERASWLHPDLAPVILGALGINTLIAAGVAAALYFFGG